LTAQIQDIEGHDEHNLPPFCGQRGAGDELFLCCAAAADAEG
jgi:hypothetical protein